MALLRSTFIALSRNSRLRHFSENSSLGRRMSSRFVAGFHLEDALAAAAALNAQGLSVTLDSLGENVNTPAEAQRSAEVYHQLLDAIAGRHLDANVSLKLTQMGMDLSPDLAEEIVSGLVDHAVRTDSFVRVDMEGCGYTQATIDLVRRLHGKPANAGHVGIVIQSYLLRSAGDIALLLGDRIRIRLCKGAYKEPPELAFPEKKDVDANYVALTKVLLTSGVFHGIATHDEAMIDATQALVREQAIDPASFEFQMLYGIRRDLQRSLVKEGYKVRVYVPFGEEWYPYFMRRLAERPANVLFIARQMLRK
ncbi:MAG TPA: proline dehydrogenase family protein [Acidobacteriaceae bacterium]|jgi:proline dehydrogenase|nr:proline dehydrogenase family protein [Acidobacteriaceae bacterium]